MVKNFLEIENVTFAASEKSKVNNVSLSIENEGEIICLLGPSGIGKTTILRTIDGLETVQSGKITLKAEEGDTVAVGQVVCLIDTSAEAPEGTPAPKEESKQEVKSAPKVEEKKEVAPSPAPAKKESYASGTPSVAAAKKMAENGIKANQVSGTGKDGRITKQDVVAAMAGGFGIMCAGDISIVHSKAKFSLTETMIGLTPAQISPYVIKKAGFANAKKLMITAEKFTGDKAREYKLADYLFNSIEELNEIEEKLKKQILQCAPRAIIEKKKILDLAFEGINQDFIDYASKNFVDQIVDGEGREGILSFVEKREPNWKK